MHSPILVAGYLIGYSKTDTVPIPSSTLYTHIVLTYAQCEVALYTAQECPFGPPPSPPWPLFNQRHCQYLCVYVCVCACVCVCVCVLLHAWCGERLNCPRVQARFFVPSPTPCCLNHPLPASCVMYTNCNDH